MTDKIALVAGATGLVGRNLLRQLQDDNYYKKIIIFSRKQIQLQDERFEVRIIDFDCLEELKLEESVTDVFCCLGTTRKQAGSKEAFYKVDFVYSLNLAKLGIEHGAKQFYLVSSLGANRHSIFYYNRVKGKLEEAICNLPFEGIHIFRPSLLLGERSEPREGENFAKKLSSIFSFLMVGPMKKFKPIESYQVARGLVQAAKNEEVDVHVYESHHIEAL